MRCSKVLNLSLADFGRFGASLGVGPGTVTRFESLSTVESLYCLSLCSNDALSESHVPGILIVEKVVQLDGAYLA